jgi:hypothetical protein
MPLVTIRVRSAAAPDQLAWLTMRVSRREDHHIHFQAEVATALAKDAVSFLAPLTPAQAQVVKSEITGGILMARKQAGKVGFVAELLSLGGSVGDERTVAALPSVAFAVAATLAVVQGLGIEDLRSAPRGGFQWKLDAVEVVEEV